MRSEKDVVKDYLQAIHIPDELKNKMYSDVSFQYRFTDTGKEADQSTYYFVDLVMEGGGMFGLALVGYTYVLEQCNIRFRNIAGTSAGAINAIALSGAGTPDQAKTLSIAAALDNVDMFSFVDGSNHVRKFIGGFNKKGVWPFLHRWTLGAGSAIKYLFKQLGLAKGLAFHQWMDEKVLKPFDSQTLGALKKKWFLPSNVVIKGLDNSPGESQPFCTLAVKASCMTAGVEVTLPRHAHLFYTDVDAAPAADFARASMSVPLFFEPFRLSSVPDFSYTKGGYQEAFSLQFKPDKTIDSAMFVDGGLMSNFPFDEFHAPRNKIPKMPTMGVKLGFDLAKFDNSSLVNFLVNMVDIAKGNSDREYRHKNYQDYRHVVKEIDTTGFGWLDFNMSDDDKIRLVQKGCDAAIAFLTEFDWPKYKALRTQLAGGGGGAPAAPPSIERPPTPNNDAAVLANTTLSANDGPQNSPSTA